MKYIFSLMILFACLFTANAQITANFTGGDTVVNTAAVDIDLRVTNAYNTAALQIVIARESGTVAGNAILKGSVDGTNFVNIDTFATANVALQTKIFAITPVYYPYYRVTYTGTGTMEAIISGKGHFKGKL